MKTYQSGTNEKKKNFFKRHWHAFVVVAAIIVVALVVTLSVVLTLPNSEPVDVPVDQPPIDEPTAEVKTVLPMAGATIGLDYSYDKLSYWETLEDWRVHPAIDFVGEGDVFAVRDGKVTSIDRHTALEGTVVTITHDDGYVSIYKSLGDVLSVDVGNTVKAGDKIGTTSKSMLTEVKTGAHLHLEMTKDGKPIDPATVLPLNEDK
ncbi:MAG: M23 family metallopeptidase [Clostridiales bacterium]|nr:M23 family metallopeptidase [Clostridiales bacterium]